MNPRTRLLVLIPLFTAAMAAAARLSIPLGPVPLTLQTLVVLLSGALLGVHGGTAMALYLGLGLMGLPLFAGGGGPQYAFSPSFGYLLSFPTSAAVVGLIVSPWDPACPKEDSAAGVPSRLRLALALLSGIAVIYAFGVPYLWWNLSAIQQTPLTPGQALMAGLVPFIGWDLAKGFLAFLIVPPLRKALSG